MSGDWMEEGRRLASQRDDLIAAGADPADLEVPIAPAGGVPKCECVSRMDTSKCPVHGGKSTWLGATP